MAGVAVAAALVVLLFFAGAFPMGLAQLSARTLWPAEWSQPASAPAAQPPAPQPGVTL